MAKKKKDKQKGFVPMVVRIGVGVAAMGIGVFGAAFVPEILAGRVKFIGDFYAKRGKFTTFLLRTGSGMLAVAPAALITGAVSTKMAARGVWAIGTIGAVGAAVYPFALPPVKKFVERLRGGGKDVTTTGAGDEAEAKGQGDVTASGAAAIAAEMDALAQQEGLNVAAGVGQVVPQSLAAGHQSGLQRAGRKTRMAPAMFSLVRG